MKNGLKIFLILLVSFTIVGCKKTENKSLTNNTTAAVEKTYKITFNSNGGSAVDEQIVNEGKTATIPTTPVKEGYTFLYWALNGSEYDFTSSVSGDITLLAIWSANTYIVRYNANGGTGTMNDSEINYGETVNLSACAFTKSKSAFIGWAIEENGEVVYENEAEVLNLSKENGAIINLYAVWRENGYQVKYNANGGEGSMNNSVFTIGLEEVLDTNTFTKAGYEFAGWALTATGEVAYSDGASVTSLTTKVGAVVDLYATWTPITYKVRFDSNSGTGTMADLSMTYDTRANLTEASFAKEHYVFKGWSLTATGEVAYNDKAEVNNLTTEKDGVVTLYAQWTENSFTVAFDANSGSGSMESIKAYIGEEFTLPSNQFTREGYKFAGWAISNNTEALYSNEDKVTISNVQIASTMTLYATWVQNQYSVKYNANGGEGSMTMSTFTVGSKGILKENTFTKTGYSFAGWALTATGEVAYADNAEVDSLTSTSGDIVEIFAIWTVNSYKIVFNANSGTGTMADLSMTYDTKANLTEVSFTKENYIFAGWSLTATGEVAYNDKAEVNNLTAEKDGVVTLYAQWTENSYTIIYNAQGATGEMENTKGYIGKTVKLSSNLFTKEHYIFIGWATEANGSVVYTNGEEISALATEIGAEITLYAVFEADESDPYFYSEEV